MMAQYSSCTEIITRSGNIQIYIFRKNKEMKEESEHKRFLRRQKLLGLALIAISIIGCIVIPEDCGGCLLAGLLGVVRVISNR